VTTGVDVTGGLDTCAGIGGPPGRTEACVDDTCLTHAAQIPIIHIFLVQILRLAALSIFSVTAQLTVNGG